MNRTQITRAGPGRNADLKMEQASPGLGSGSVLKQASPGPGAGVTVRRAGVADLTALADFFGGLSVQSRYLRFFAPVRPSPALLRLLCGEPGDVDAVVAVRDGVIIGHAMAADAAPLPDSRGPEAARDGRTPPAKDIGIVVADAWQGQGVGAALMRTLIAAIQARGVTTLAMDVLEGNRKVLAMISAHWPATRAGRSRDCVTVEVRLPPPRPRRIPATAGSRRAVSTAAGPAAWSGRAQVSRAARA
jgi:GNAT superfamily N-acetyltransferase